VAPPPASPAGAILDGKAARTRRRILDAAARTFAEHGYAGSSVSRIAQAADLQPGSLYFHFAGKDELIAEVLHEGVERSLTHVQAAVAALGSDAPAATRLRTAIHAHLQALHLLSDHAAAVLRIVDEAPAPVRERHRALDRRYARWWTDLLRAAQREGAIDAGLDVRVVRDLLFAAMNGTYGPDARRRHSIERLTDTLSAMWGRSPDSVPADRRAPPAS
jgi:AcrR family transcriptional regulator